VDSKEPVQASCARGEEAAVKGLRAVAVLLAFVTIFVLAPTGHTQTRPYAGRTIRFLRHSGYEATWIRNRLADFERETGIKTLMDEITYTNMHDKQVIELSSKSGTYDLYAIPDFWVGEYGKAGWLLPLNQFLDNKQLVDPKFDRQDLIKRVVDLYTYQGKILALPYKYNTRILFYRKDLLEKSKTQVPRTWEEFLTTSRRFTQSGVFGTGASFGAAAITDLFLDFLYSSGGKFLDGNRPAFNSPQGVAAVNFMREMMKYSPPGALSRHWDESGNLLAQGLVVMDIQIPFFAGVLQDEKRSVVVGKIGYANIPGNPTSVTYISGWAMAIGADSKNPEPAFLLIQWLLSKDNIRRLTIDTDGGIVPARNSVLSDQQLLSRYPQLAPSLRAAQNAWAYPQVAGVAAMQQALVTNLHEALQGRKDVKGALDAAASEVLKILQQK
jgi:multiple sugar transport system substrate-binding protein